MQHENFEKRKENTRQIRGVYISRRRVILEEHVKHKT